MGRTGLAAGSRWDDAGGDARCDVGGGVGVVEGLTGLGLAR